MIKILATDLDGTLLYPKRPLRVVSRRNKAVIRRLHQKGIKIILVSGRGPWFCQLVRKKLQVPCGIISCSGAYIEQDGKVITERTIPNPIVKEIYDQLYQEKDKVGFIITTDDYHLYGTYKGFKLIERGIIRFYMLKSGRYLEKLNTKKNIFLDFIKNSDRGVLKFVLYLSDYIGGNRYQVAEDLKQKYSDQLSIAVTKSGLEITASNIDKGKALVSLVDYIELDHKDVAVVGDDGNDIPMFNLFENSFAMNNGYPAAKEHAKYRVSSFKELEKIISKL